jgi:hypothetical protein
MVHNMSKAVNLLLDSFKLGLSREEKLFSNVRIHFVGTSYAPGNLAKPSILPIAAEKNIEGYVQEQPNRVAYFDALQLLEEADMLLMLGNNDTQYTASKLYPYIMARKPILAAFNRNSSVVGILRKTRAGEVVTFDGGSAQEDLLESTYKHWSHLLRRLPFTPPTNWKAFEPYMAREMTSRQVDSFNAAIQQRVYTHK